jgi:flagellar hook-associated protein 2
LQERIKFQQTDLKKNQRFESGVLRVSINDDERSITFRGGNLESLKNQIDDEFDEIISTSIVNTGAESQVLVIESRTAGKNGELKITGDLAFLRQIGLVNGYKDEEKDQVNLVFDTTYFQVYTGTGRELTDDGSLEVAEDGKSFTITGTLWREYVLPNPYDVQTDTVLEFEASHEEQPSEADELENLPYKVELGPSETTAIQGIELEGYNISRERPLDPPENTITPDRILGVGVIHLDENGERVEELYTVDPESEGVQTIPLGANFAGKKITRVIFYSNKDTVVFKDASISTPIEGQELLNPKNVISAASNAKLKIDDIEIERAQNEGINDVIQGVSLNLQAADPDTRVELTINQDIDGSVEKIKEFVKQYNEYIEYNKELTKAGQTDKAGDFDEAKRNNGLFVGDMTIIRIENSLKRTVSTAYPSTADKPVKLLSEIGVSTGKLNASWAEIQEGKLTIDEDKLREKLSENPDGVKDLFGSDTDGDNRIDDGFAYTFENILKPYTQPGKNIIASKIDLQEDSIDQLEDQISRKQDHLETYEEKLRQKFTNMERTMSGSKAQQQWMQSQMGGSSQNNDK